MNFPFFAIFIVRSNGSIAKIDAQAAAQSLIVKKVSLYLFAAISERDKEVVITVMSVVLRDVPKNWVTADLHHWLRLYLSFFGEPAAPPPARIATFTTHAPQLQG